MSAWFYGMPLKNARLSGQSEPGYAEYLKWALGRKRGEMLRRLWMRPAAARWIASGGPRKVSQLVSTLNEVLRFQ